MFYLLISVRGTRKRSGVRKVLLAQKSLQAIYLSWIDTIPTGEDV